MVLEVGCSSGLLLRLIAEHLQNAVVMGSDVVHEPLEQLASFRLDLPLFRFDLVKCPFPDNCMDAVIMLNVLEHIENDVAAVEQVYRVLKPGGIAIIEVPTGPDLYDVYDKSLMHFRRYSLSGLRKLVERVNLRIIEQSHLGFFLYPGFNLVKRRNRKLLSKSEDVQHQRTEQNIRKTAGSQFLRMITQFELAMGKYVTYPFGIRCLLTCVKQKE